MMTLRQRLLQWIYPAWMLFRKGKSQSVRPKPEESHLPPVSFYSLHTTLNSNQDFDFEKLRGKQVLLVNTASNCGFTPQYDELQSLYEQYRENLVVIGFPANDFKEQEKGSDEEIAEFCRVNFGVTFPLAKKSVVKGENQNPVFQWLTRPELNGWNHKQPEWNFSKYLISDTGVLLQYYPPSVSPLSDEILHQLKKK